jgi:hypothetical protein
LVGFNVNKPKTQRSYYLMFLGVYVVQIKGI